jgi:hypothetical protein
MAVPLGLILVLPAMTLPSAPYASQRVDPSVLLEQQQDLRVEVVLEAARQVVLVISRSPAIPAALALPLP